MKSAPLVFLGAISLLIETIVLAADPPPGNLAPPLFWESYNEQAAQLRHGTVSDGRGGLYVGINGGFDLANGQLIGSPIRLLAADGTIDTSFRPGPTLTFDSAVAVQPDGRVLVTRGHSGVATVVRLDPDGTIDTSFKSPFFDRAIRWVTLLPNAQILITFNAYFRLSDPPPGVIPVPSPTLVRLQPDGTLDSTFHPPALVRASSEAVLWAPPAVDGAENIYIGGDFSAVDGQPRVNFARLRSNGEVDSGYSALASVTQGVRSQVRALGLQSDGKAIVVGSFNIPPTSGTPIAALRFNGDGTIDQNFAQVKTSSVRGPNGIRPWAMVMLTNDQFAVVTDMLARFNSDGSLDSGFHQALFSNQALWIAHLEDGRFVVPGILTADGVPVNGLAVFGPNGQVDPAWLGPGFGKAMPLTDVLSLADGRIAVAGLFNRVGVSNLVGFAVLSPGTANLEATQIDLGAMHPQDSIDALYLFGNGPMLETGLTNSIYYLATLVDTNNFDTGTRTLFFRMSPSTGQRDIAFNQDNWEPSWRDFLSHVEQMVAEPDGNVLLLAGGSPQAALDGKLAARVLADGSIDPTFSGIPGALLSKLVRIDRAIDGSLQAIHLGYLQLLSATTAQGRLAIFTSLDGLTSLIQLDRDLTPDLGFIAPSISSPTEEYSDFVVDLMTGMFLQVPVRSSLGNYLKYAIVLTNGTILVAGQFDNFGGYASDGLVRLNANGRVDATFPPLNLDYDEYPPENRPNVRAVTTDESGNIYLAGRFTRINGHVAPGLGRLKPSGAVDVTFNAGLMYLDNGFGGGLGGGEPVFLKIAGDRLIVAGPFRATGEVFPHALWVVDLASASVLRVLTTSIDSGGVRLSVPSIVGSRYFVEFKNSLVESVWTSLPAVTGDGSVISLNDPGPTVAQRFYRVRQE